MRPHTWSRFSFGRWLKTASERLHRHKLAIALANKLARIAWGVLRHGLRHTPQDRGDLALSTEFAIEKMHGTDS
jgi:hypothetical protein